MYTRRELMKCLAAGGMVTAAGLWTPGAKLISLPPKRILFKHELVWGGSGGILSCVGSNPSEYAEFIGDGRTRRLETGKHYLLGQPGGFAIAYYREV